MAASPPPLAYQACTSPLHNLHTAIWATWKNKWGGYLMIIKLYSTQSNYPDIGSTGLVSLWQVPLSWRTSINFYVVSVDYWIYYHFEMKAELLFQNRSTSPSLNAKREANSTVSNGFGIPVLIFPTILGKTSIICAIKDPHHFFFSGTALTCFPDKVWNLSLVYDFMPVKFPISLKKEL